MREKLIVHVDMDAFFAAIEQRDNPAIKGKPVVIGANPKKGKGRGVVSTCSYEARKYGIHSAMPISIAYKKCPYAVFLEPCMSKYDEESDKIFTILEKFTPDIEPISIDEAFLDITGSFHLFGTPLETCEKIKAEIKKETGLTASLGMAPNKMTAKIASDINKPDGLLVIPPQKLLEFLHPLPVSRLWGIGEKTTPLLASIGINTIGDLAKKGIDELELYLGKNGIHAWQLANGIDPRDVKMAGPAKSISNEYTFEKDTNNKHQILDTLMFLSEKVSRRLRKAGLKAKTITLKIRFSDFETYTRSITLKTPVNFTDVIYQNAVQKFVETPQWGVSTGWKNKIRLIGVSVSNFSAQESEWSFDEKKENLHKAIDKIQDRFGENIMGYRFPLTF